MYDRSRGERFEAQGIQGGRTGATETSKGEYVRLLPKIDITKEGEGDRIVQVIEEVLHNLAVRVPVEGQCGPETEVGGGGEPRAAGGRGPADARADVIDYLDKVVSFVAVQITEASFLVK